MSSIKQPFSKIRRTAVEVKNYRSFRRVAITAIGLLITLLILIYIVSSLFMKYGSFTIKIVDYFGKNFEGYALSLSDRYDFLHPVSYLNTFAVKELTNIDGSRLPPGLNDVDSSHNGDNYLAYTFYLKNVGTKSCSY